MIIIINHILTQVAEAINYLHVTRKMVHLNICPQNIIVTKKGIWKIMGFGFAKTSDPEALDVSAE